VSVRPGPAHTPSGAGGGASRPRAGHGDAATSLAEPMAPLRNHRNVDLRGAPDSLSGSVGQLDAGRFPRVAAYLRGLPDGIASYPDAMVKASMYRDAILDRPLTDAVEYLPPQVAELVLRPPLVSTWIVSVPVQAIFLAIADHHRMSEEAFAAWTHRTQKSLLGGRLYRAMVALASPTLLLNGTRVRWGSFHRGSEIEVTQTGPNEAHLAVLFPRGLFAPTNLRGFVGGFQAIAELSNAKPVSVTLVDAKPTRGDFLVRWREAT
jgi:hypothetical protein